MNLSFSEYQKRAISTAIYRESNDDLVHHLTGGQYNGQISQLLNMLYASLGLGEVGELQGKVKKIIRDSGGHISDETRAAISKELGDVLWYLSVTASEFDLDLGSIAEQNLDKLANRKERGTLKGSGDNR
jgi:NTP pyrophosphatase (non-canonical NTP hydrolase)